MLVTRYNPATDTEEIQRLTPGPWSTEPLQGAKLAGTEWAVEAPDPVEALASLGLTLTDAVVQYQVNTDPFGAPEVELSWPRDPRHLYRVFRDAFDDRWAREGHPPEDFLTLATGPLAVPPVSGVALVDGAPAGCILAERLEGVMVPSLYYRVFGILPTHRRRGVGLALFTTSLGLARSHGFEHAYWCCYAGNTPVNALMGHLGATPIAECGYWEGSPQPVRSGWINPPSADD